MTEVLILLGLLLIGGLAYLAALGGTLEVRRSIRIRAPAARVYQRLRDLRSWETWSPWLIHDRQALLSYSDETDRVGGWYAWDSRMLGAGRLTHVALDEAHTLIQRLEFFRPFKSQSEVRWELQPKGEDTEVSWSMRGAIPFWLRWLLPKLTRAQEQDFDLGLAMLRGTLEPGADFPRIDFEGPVEQPAQSYLCKRFSGSLEAMKQAMQTGYPELMRAAQDHGCKPTGPILAIYHRFNANTRSTVCDLALPVEAATAPAGYQLLSLPQGRYFRVTLRGGYEFLEAAWNSAFGHLRMAKLKYDGKRPPIEIYDTNPSQVGSSQDLLTSIYLPLRDC